MNYLIRYKYHFIALALLILLLLTGAKTKVARISDIPSDLPKVQSQGQLEHALELFSASEQLDLLSISVEEDQRPYILNIVQTSLPEAYKSRAYEISRAVITEANHHKMDPLFLLAVIQTESQFNLKARGRHGEIGLMQVLPKTAQWLAAQAGIRADQVNLEDPAINIRIGATYFALLRKRFDKVGSRYVAAYNMGSTNVRRLVRNNIEPYIYSGKVIGNYKGLYGKLEKAQQLASNIASAE